MERLCEGRVVIVTGAGRGLGREYALMLARHGAKVVVNDLGADAAGIGATLSPAQEVVAEIQEAGGSAVVNGDDVADWEGARRVVAQTVDAFGKLDVLINNAGILRDRMMVNMTEQEWDDVIRVHLKGSFAPAHHAAVHWRDRFKAEGMPLNARLINTSSVSGIYGSVGQTNYGTAKMGITGLTVIAGRELERYGVTSNAIAPIAQTRLTQGLRDRTEEEIAQRHPRFVASVATWLASERSGDVTGRVFEAGGGVVAVAEGWHRGPKADQMEDPVALGAVLQGLVSSARPNAGKNGVDLPVGKA